MSNIFRNRNTLATLPRLNDKIIVREYGSSGTWYKPAGLRNLFVICVGAGGGGGSGRRGAVDTARGAASGGSGGGINFRMLSNSQLSASHSITIGTGGTGGSAITVDSTNGNDGIAGGNTSFGSLVIAIGGSKGIKGSTSAAGTGGGGPSYNGTPRNYGITGGGGGQGNIASAGGVGAGIMYTSGCSGGGGGGCISNANVKYNSGGVNQGYDHTGTSISTTSGVSEGITPSDGGDNLHLGLLLQYGINYFNATKGLGNGGIGGGCGDTVAAGAGSNGGDYGAGGGGGGGSTNGYASGKGGDGSGGLVVLIEIY